MKKESDTSKAGNSAKSENPVKQETSTAPKKAAVSNKINAKAACSVLGLNGRNRFVVLRRFINKQGTKEEWSSLLKKEKII